MKKFEQYGCELKNESECEQELENDSFDLEDAEGEMFGEQYE
jgi:hypothetical protein